MRNIGFDESSVMNELMKIAHDKNLLGLEKAAEEPRGEITQRDVPESLPAPIVEPRNRQLMLIDQDLDGFKNINALHAGSRSVQIMGLVKELGDFLKYKNRAEMHPEGVKRYNELLQTLKSQLAGALAKQIRMSERQGVNKERVQELKFMLDNLKAAKPAMAKTSAKKHDNVKIADDHYDVTKSTGKEIIDEAHPGGGTKTELSHSKTDDNLVETIFEAHEKHLEVARKKPTGVYAALADLYLDLSKIGYKENLKGLKKLIRSFATREAVIEHTLVRLADSLDANGHVKAANAVDNLLKKKIAEEPETVNLLKGTPFDKGESVHNFPEDVITVNREKSKQKFQARNQAVALFQRRYNRLLGLKPGDPKYLKEDGVMGPNTTKAKYDNEYIAAHIEDQKNQGKEADVARFLSNRVYRPVDAMRLFIGKFKEKFPGKTIKPGLKQRMRNMSERFSQIGLEKSKEEMDDFLNKLEAKMRQ